MGAMRTVLLSVVLVAIAASGRISAQDAELQKQIDQAIDRGVEYLKKFQRADGSWQFRKDQTDMTALVAWTLLESGVGPKDPSIVKAATILRKLSISDRRTYCTALHVIFFDKLGDSADELLIEALGARLLWGITRYGGWTYNTGPVDPKGDKELEEAIKKFRDDAPAKPEPDAQRKLHQLTVAQLEAMKKAGVATAYLSGDNSNTQFAALALWVARRHGLPVDQHLALVEKRFRESRAADGGWGYMPFLQPGHAVTGTMTCAGLLGFALGEGAKLKGKTTKELLEDADVKKSLALLANFVGKTADPSKPPESGKPTMGPYYYFLFSLERMAVIYDLKTIGDTDWYVWGARELIKRQGKNGSWIESHDNADTCFALLFLKKANVAEDLSVGLKGIVGNPDKKKPAPKEIFDFPILIPKTPPKAEKPGQNKEPKPESKRGPQAEQGRSEQGRSERTLSEDTLKGAATDATDAIVLRRQRRS